MNDKFEFTSENKQEFERILARYPRKRAALLPTLHLAQEQHGYISAAAERYVSELLEVPLVDVCEVLTFYTLFHREPTGTHHIKVCTSLSCWVRGSDKVRRQLAEKLGVASGGKTPDGSFSWEAVPDCMGACEIAPMLQFDKDYIGNLTEAKVDIIVSGQPVESLIQAPGTGQAGDVPKGHRPGN